MPDDALSEAVLTITLRKIINLRGGGEQLHVVCPFDSYIMALKRGFGNPRVPVLKLAQSLVFSSSKDVPIDLHHGCGQSYLSGTM